MKLRTYAKKKKPTLLNVYYITHTILDNTITSVKQEFIFTSFFYDSSVEFWQNVYMYNVYLFSQNLHFSSHTFFFTFIQLQEKDHDYLND